MTTEPDDTTTAEAGPHTILDRRDSRTEPAARNSDATIVDRVAEASATTRDRSGPAVTTRDRMRAFGGDTQRWLPPLLAAQMDIEQRLPAVGAEADVFVVRMREDGAVRVLKLYRPGVELDRTLMDNVCAAEEAHVVDIYDFDICDGQWYELQEFVASGSLVDLFEAEGPTLSEPLVESIVRELATALDHLHQRELWHRDVKPANVLVRRREPLDLVLTDFGLSVLAAGSQAFASTSRTPAYAAPEALWNVVGPFRDYWSLGMIVVEALTGKTPFDGATEYVINRFLAEGQPLDLTAVAAGRWRTLAEGLLTWEHEYRWGASEVEAWLRGESPPVHRQTARARRAAAQPYKMPDGDCHTLSDLARSLARNWSEGRSRWGRGRIIDWLEKVGTDENLLNQLLDIRSSGEDADLQLFRAIQTLDPTLPPVFDGRALTPDGLSGLAAEAVEGSTQARDIVASLDRHRVLAYAAQESAREIDRRWRDARTRFEAIAQRVPPSVPAEVSARVPAALLGVVASRDDEDELARRAAEAFTLEARQQAWYGTLGGPTTAGPAELFALTVFGGEAAAATSRHRDAQRRAATQVRDDRRSRRNEREQSARAAARDNARLRARGLTNAILLLLAITGVWAFGPTVASEVPSGVPRLVTAMAVMTAVGVLLWRVCASFSRRCRSIAESSSLLRDSVMVAGAIVLPMLVAIAGAGGWARVAGGQADNVAARSMELAAVLQLGLVPIAVVGAVAMLAAHRPRAGGRVMLFTAAQVVGVAVLQTWTGVDGTSWWLPAALEGSLLSSQTMSSDTVLLVTLACGVAVVAVGVKLASALRANDMRAAATSRAS